jgi:tetratricopeptide (TPR) repeat protein
MVDACTLLGNIYSSMNNSEEAYKYYQKALESLDENASEETVSELYFKFALVNDDKGDAKTAFEYYTRCISLLNNSPYKSLAYSNLGSCYFDNDNYTDALHCFEKAYELDKSTNNYEGVYFNSLYLAKIYNKEEPDKSLNYFIEAKQSAEFLNEDFYILEATVALGDFYYNNTSWHKKALNEYFSAQKIANRLGDSVDISKINSRIKDMKLRMSEEDYTEIKKKYE